MALDEFMQDFRVEERSYVRESKSLSARKKSMVMQERLFFRNIPLSNWIEHEMVVEEGHDLDQLPKESVFTTATIAGTEGPDLHLEGRSEGRSEGRLPVAAGEGRIPFSKMLDEFETPAAKPKPHRENDLTDPGASGRIRRAVIPLSSRLGSLPETVSVNRYRIKSS